MSKQENNSCVSTLFSSLSLLNKSPPSQKVSNNENKENKDSNEGKRVHLSNKSYLSNSILSADPLVNLLKRTMYPIVQENGQRRYGPPPKWSGESPKRGCEVFVGKIPRDCFEDELVPVFEKIGPIYMFRLMMDFVGTNRGYGFCVYMNRDDAKRAVDELNNYEIRSEKLLGVCLSVDNCRLFVGGIPKHKMRNEIYAEMSRVTDGVRDVIAYPSVADKTKNRGFAFIEYESHKLAAMARRKLMPGRIHLWGQQIAVDWAEPEREVNEDIMQLVKVLYVRNLMLSTTEDTIRNKFIIASNGTYDCVERVKKMKDYAFVHFRERHFAERAMDLLNNTQIDGSWIEVTWAKPVEKTDQKSKVNGLSTNQMEFTNNAELLQATGASQIFYDSTSGISYIGAPIQTVQTNQNFANNANRRNAAGSRSASNREKKANTEAEEYKSTMAWPTGYVPRLEWDGYAMKYQYVPTQMMYPAMNYVAPNTFCPPVIPATMPPLNPEEVKSMSETLGPVMQVQEGTDVSYDGMSNQQVSLGSQPFSQTLMSQPPMSHPTTQPMYPQSHFSAEAQQPSFYFINPAPPQNSGYTTTAMPHPYFTAVAPPQPYVTAFQPPQPTTHMYTTATLATPSDYTQNAQLNTDQNNTTFLQPMN